MQLAAFKLLLMLAIANGAPVIAKKVLGQLFAYPLDGGWCFADGRPILGSTKTVRGLVLAIIATAISAPILAVSWKTGAAIGGAAMAGDLISSFIKRRMKLPPSSKALGIDQIPESLLPAMVGMSLLGLDFGDLIAVVALFFAGELILSHVLFRLHIREQPY
jgi:CDP-2,3-bis-(O-geranylgeranyl)-sn-glycerol synthase